MQNTGLWRFPVEASPEKSPTHNAPPDYLPVMSCVIKRATVAVRCLMYRGFRKTAANPLPAFAFISAGNTSPRPIKANLL